MYVCYLRKTGKAFTKNSVVMGGFMFFFSSSPSKPDSGREQNWWKDDPYLEGIVAKFQ